MSNIQEICWRPCRAEKRIGEKRPYMSNLGASEEYMINSFLRTQTKNAFAWPLKTPLNKIILGQDLIPPNQPPKEENFGRQIPMPEPFKAHRNMLHIIIQIYIRIYLLDNQSSLLHGPRPYYIVSLPTIG